MYTVVYTGVEMKLGVYKSVRNRMRILLCAAVAALAVAAGAAADEHEDKLYKWVDEDGNVTYQDQPPPDNGDGERIDAFVDQGVETDPPSADADPVTDVVLYSIEPCETCDLVRELMEERRIPFEEKNASVDREIQAELEEVAGVLSVPVLLIGDQVLRGYNKALILRELELAGYSVSDQETADAMTPEELEQAARSAALDGEDDDLFDEDLDIFSDEDGGPDSGDDITEWEEIPEDERIDVTR